MSSYTNKKLNKIVFENFSVRFCSRRFGFTIRFFTLRGKKKNHHNSAFIFGIHETQGNIIIVIVIKIYEIVIAASQKLRPFFAGWIDSNTNSVPCTTRTRIKFKILKYNIKHYTIRRNNSYIYAKLTLWKKNTYAKWNFYELKIRNKKKKTI